RRVTEARHERAQRLHGRVARRDRLHDLDELHDHRRIEEVQSREPVWPFRRGGDLDDREAGGVRGEDGRWRAHAVELLEDLLLRIHDLDDRFDHEVAVLEVRQRGGPADAAAGLLRVVLGDFAGLHDARERRVDAREASLDELLIDLARDDVETGHSAHLRDARAHLSETDDPDALDGHGVLPSCWRLEWARTAYRDARYDRRVVSAASDAPTFWVGRSPATSSRLPYLLRLPVSGEGRLFLAARETWPRGTDVFCHQLAEWPVEAEVIEEVSVEACWRVGAAVHLVLRRARQRRSLV